MFLVTDINQKNGVTDIDSNSYKWKPPVSNGRLHLQDPLYLF